MTNFKGFFGGGGGGRQNSVQLWNHKPAPPTEVIEQIQAKK